MPENDRSDGDRSEDYEDETSEELREFLDSEYFEEMGDDLLLDQLGRGEDNRTIYDAPDDDDLQDAAHDWRESVEDTPLPESTSPDAVMAEFERRKKAAVPPGPRTPESGGTTRMAINEDAAQLAQMGQDETVQGMIGAAKGHIGDAIAALAGAQQHAEQAGAQAGSLLGGSEGEAVNGQGQQVAQEISNLIGQLASADGAADDVNGYANAFLTAVRDAAAKHGGGS